MFTRPAGLVEMLTSDLFARSIPRSGLDDALFEYELFAVINHEGQIDNGHYTNYARFKDEWFKFDDDRCVSSAPSFLTSLFCLVPLSWFVC